MLERCLATTQKSVSSGREAAEALTARTIATIYALATGATEAALWGFASWSDAAANIAPLIQNPSFLMKAVELYAAAHSLGKPFRPGVTQLYDEARIKLDIIIRVGERVAELHQDAIDDNLSFSEASHADLRRFLAGIAFSRRPSIFLLDNGNLRAVWKNEQKEQLGLQFLGGGAVQYVAFRQRHALETMSRLSGAENLDYVRKLIADFGHLVG
jgi:hypothetical protein